MRQLAVTCFYQNVDTKKTSVRVQSSEKSRGELDERGHGNIGKTSTEGAHDTLVQQRHRRAMESGEAPLKPTFHRLGSLFR